MCLFFHEITLFSHHFPFFCSLRILKSNNILWGRHQPQTSMFRLLEYRFLNRVWLVLNYLSVYLNPAHWSLISFMHCFFFMKCVSHCSLCGSYIDVVVRSTNKYICLWIWHLVTTATTTSYIKYYNSIVTQSAIGTLLLGSESHK